MATTAAAARGPLRIDWNLLGTALVISAVGELLVYSATYFSADRPLFMRQLLWIGIGVALMFAFLSVDYHVLMDIAPVLYTISLVLLAYVLFWGRLTRHVRSWIHIGSFEFQPAEFAKIFTALMIAKYFESHVRAYMNFRNFATVMAIIAAPVLLIAVQPAFGSAATFFPLVAIAMFFGGIRPRFWIAMILIAAIILPLGWQFLKPFQKERVMIFLDPERDPLGSGYQVTQAKIATGSGGITGRGFLKGTQVNLEFLPARHTDFIFSVLAEEWGFVGVSIVLGLYLYLIAASLLVAKHARDRGGTFLVLGLISFFFFHVVINVAMQIGVVPVTGIPLPLISYGGSQTMMFFIAIGLILNVEGRRFGVA